jgi:DNA modification methylase
MYTITGQDHDHAEHAVTIFRRRDQDAAECVRLLDEEGWYCWYAESNVLVNRTAWEAVGIRYHQAIQWVKPTAILGFCMWNFKSEPCLMGWQQGHRPLTNKIDEMTNVWQVDWEGKGRCTDGVHPTQKPIRLFELPMQKHTRLGDVCLETFSGSGSQIIAAEGAGRRCFAVERMPGFTDVAVLRWQRFTGKEAILEGDGRTFAEIAKERVPEVVDEIEAVGVGGLDELEHADRV